VIKQEHLSDRDVQKLFVKRGMVFFSLFDAVVSVGGDILRVPHLGSYLHSAKGRKVGLMSIGVYSSLGYHARSVQELCVISV
jgi:hypothetical protein